MSPFYNLKLISKLGLGAAVLISLFCHMYGLSISELQGDEASVLLIAAKMSLFTEDIKHLGHLFLFGHAPMRVLLTLPGLWLFGFEEWALRFPHALLGALAVFPAFFIGKRVHSEEGGVVAALLLSGLSICLGNRLAMGVGPYIFFGLLAVDSFTAYVLQGRKGIRFCWSLLAMILCYVEGGLIAIAMFLATIVWKGSLKNFLGQHLKSILATGSILVGFVAAWAFVPWYSESQGWVSSRAGLGIFRIFGRASEGLNNSVPRNIEMMEAYFGEKLGSVFLLAVFLASLALLFFAITKKDKTVRSRIAISLAFLVPAVYFSFFVREPTNHILFYLPYGVVCLGIFLSELASYTPNRLHISIVGALFFALGSLLQTKDIVDWPSNIPWGPKKYIGWKSLGILTRQHVDVNERFVSDLEGYVTRVYLGRRYEVPENWATTKYANIAIMSKRYDPPEGWSYNYNMSCQGRYLIHIYSRDDFKGFRIPVNFDCRWGVEEFRERSFGPRDIVPYF